MNKYHNMELRKLPASFLAPISEILEINEDWKKVMNLIPKNVQGDVFERKYNIEHMRLIQEHAQATGQKNAKVLFDEWGCSGKIRPTGETLMNILYDANIIRAGDQLADKLQLPKRQRPAGPGAMINVDVTALLNQDSSDIGIQHANGTNGSYGSAHNASTKPMEDKKSINLIQFSEVSDCIPLVLGQAKTVSIDQSDNLSTQSEGNSVTESMHMQSSLVPSVSRAVSEGGAPNSFQIPTIICQIDDDLLTDDTLIQFEFKELESMTNNFHPNNCIGSGGFGLVFVGTHPAAGQVAIKKAHNMQIINMTKMFNSEVKSLSMLKHEYVVPILGYSIDGEVPCIVCEYIEGGSLLQKIADKVLSEIQRLNIMIGTAEGLKYIHNTERPGETTQTVNNFFLHGDVKSANILLTKNCTPKLCDFGLAREYKSTFITQSIMGTTAYMAPERYGGTITQKGDIYSYGIVLLELLTGKPPTICDGSATLNILYYVRENTTNNDISPLLDPVVPVWTIADNVYELVQQCLLDYIKRPTMDTICERLHELEISKL